MLFTIEFSLERAVLNVEAHCGDILKPNAEANPTRVPEPNRAFPSAKTKSEEWKSHIW